MRMTFALVIALVTLMPQSADSTPLTITYGSIVITPELGPRAFFGGDNFFVVAFEEPGSGPPLPPAFGVNPFVYPVRFNTFADVLVGNEECIAFPSINVGCGEITLTSPGFAMPADWPITTPFVATVPFMAAGFLLLEDTQIDIGGSGMVTGSNCLAGPHPACDNQTMKLEYTFAVPEPSTLLLNLVSGIVLLLITFVRRWAFTQASVVRDLHSAEKLLKIRT
jgi:hypothetical protein